MKKTVYQKVLERLVYEKILLANDIQEKRNRITLDELLEAGEAEPRILAVLPAVLWHKPGILYRLNFDIKKHPQLEGMLKMGRVGFVPEADDFYGIDWKDCFELAEQYKAYLDFKESEQKSKTVTLRMSPADIALIKEIQKKMGCASFSEAVRQLAFRFSL